MTILDRIDIEVLAGNVLTVRADLLFLKHAKGYHGADAAVASALGLTLTIRRDRPFSTVRA